MDQIMALVMWAVVGTVLATVAVVTRRRAARAARRLELQPSGDWGLSGVLVTQVRQGPNKGEQIRVLTLCDAREAVRQGRSYLVCIESLSPLAGPNRSNNFRSVLARVDHRYEWFRRTAHEEGELPEAARAVLVDAQRRCVSDLVAVGHGLLLVRAMWTADPGPLLDVAERAVEALEGRPGFVEPDNPPALPSSPGQWQQPPPA